MATPQWAMAHPASALATSAKAFSASTYQNEWRSATARSKDFSTAGLQEVAKWTVPNTSVGLFPGVAPSSCASSREANRKTASNAKNNDFVDDFILLMISPSSPRLEETCSVMSVK